MRQVGPLTTSRMPSVSKLWKSCRVASTRPPSLQGPPIGDELLLPLGMFRQEFVEYVGPLGEQVAEVDGYLLAASLQEGQRAFVVVQDQGLGEVFGRGVLAIVGDPLGEALLLRIPRL